MRAVFLDTQTFSTHVNFSNISARVNELKCYGMTSPNEVIERCAGFDIIITNKVILNKEHLSQLPSLKLICIAATGTNNIDTEAANTQGITVCNAAGYAGPSVAQYIIAQLLAYFHNIGHHNKNVADGLWGQSATFCFLGNPMEELSGKTLGLIGYGHIAKQLEKIALAFDMNVLVSDHKNAQAIRNGRTNFNDVLTQSDIISLHCPLTDDTHHLVNQDFLAKMKKTAVLVNTARGQIIDTSALVNALNSEIISYAILDVLDQEPPPENHPLLCHGLKNISITAHIAWASQQAQQRLIDIIAENINCYQLGNTQNKIV